MRKFGVIALLACLPFTPAIAQYQGPGGAENSTAQPAYAPNTVAAIKADPKDDMKVTLEGTLTSKTGDETYVFSDGTGEITVEIDDDDFPKEPVNADTVVVLEGEVDTHLTKDADIDVERITIKK